ncbi:Phosphatidate phosphatase LPIN3 [Babesia bigemina]|uniref:phosphatidate phosphatase n=1 Tax=Babesia bigemina TaxID=5866 RepID=A0A061D7T6_BABBI|nr:Phosphatidate phosphatase LPIN3 [Babesia bigemina]CDR94969.1 Phosphatidate phosphatase LPIN3 [Babesia bigemina]|eukprot:XP_012767155.1 Phosphatidate phosphatase LPIN3 [Babesia bigemina]
MWEKLYSSVVSVLDFNQATLSGCVDIICVRHKEVVDGPDGCSPSGECAGFFTHDIGSAAPCNDGDPELRPNERWVYRSTSFHVRFGKTKLLKSREKTVSVYVNGQLSNLTMKLGAAGEAYFDDDSGDAAAGTLSPYAHQLSDMSVLSEENGDSAGYALMDYGYYACSNSRYSVKSDDADPASQSSAPRASQGQPNTDRNSDPSHAQHESGWRTAASSKGSIGEYSRGWDELSIQKDVAGNSPDDQILQFSLCGHLLSAQDETLNRQLFESNMVDWERLNADPSLWYHPSLVARFDNRPPYYPSKIALPLLASWIVYNKPLSGEAIATLLRTTVLANSSPSPLPARSTAQDVRSNMSPPRYAGSRAFRRFRVSIRPTSEQLAALNLKMGVNNITFTVNSSWQGTKSVHAKLYLWPADARIVISDVDGTITKSDALGHIMPILGRDWSHTGVAELFTKIRSNGYRVMYLTARAIGQADYTREYLFGLTQKEKDKLPHGPLFLSPDRLLPAFKREVISRSAYMFKIPALRDIRNLFPPDHNPFYAGFGNNESDHRAYVSVGVPENRVFIINPSGIIRHVNVNYAKTYESMSDIAELMFPPCPDAQSNADDEQLQGQ